MFSLTEAADGWRVDFALGEVALRHGADGLQVNAAGLASQAAAVGLPLLPQASRLLLVPRGCTVRLSESAVLDSDTLWLDASQAVRPYGGATVKDGPPAVAEPDKSVYGTDAWHRDGPPVALEDLGLMGRRRVLRVTVRPVAYNPVRKGLAVCNRISARLTVSAPPEAVAADAERAHMVIVSRPQFCQGLQPFVRWKRQEGYVVTEVYTPTAQRDSVRALIPAGCDYLLLVGDVEQLQAWVGTTHPEGMGGHVTDLYYAERTGDYLPDALVGRWPVTDTAELAAVLRKTLRYEQGLDLDTAALKRLLLVAGLEAQSPAPTTTNGQVNYVSREAALAHPGLDTVCFRNPASASHRTAILGEVGQGAAMLNYTAHCTTAGWSQPAVGFASVDTLACTQPMLWVNNCCLSNAFDGTCFGEQLLRKPDGGAIGVIGATNSTLWNEDYYWAVGPKYPLVLQPDYDSTRLGAFDRWTGRAGGVLTQGELLAAGNLAVTAFGSPYDRFYWETYCLLGDPTLRPWLGVPLPLQLAFAEGAPRNGDAALPLDGTPGATVTAMQHDSVLGCGRVGEDGRLTLPLAACLDTTPLLLTATAPGRLPRVDTVSVAPATGKAVALREATVADSMVACRVENVGSLPLYGLTVSLRQTGIDSSTDGIIAEQQTLIDSLLPHGSRPVALPVQMLCSGLQPSWQALLSAVDSVGDTLCCLAVRHLSDVALPTVVFRLLETDGSEAHSLLPSHGYRLATTIEGEGVDVAISLSALNHGETVYASAPSESDFLFTTPDSLTHLCLEACLSTGNHDLHYRYYMVAEPRTDGFDAGFAAYPWRLGGTRPWTLDEQLGCARSGDIAYRQTSDLLLDVLLHQADTVSFRARASSEAGYDKLLFSVDGVTYGPELSGETPWTPYSVPLPVGRHTLRWRYVKDESGSDGSDCVWLDDVRMPLALWDSAYGFHAPLGIRPSASVGQLSLSVYPNPASDGVSLTGVEGRMEVRLQDILGRVVYRCTALLPAVLRLPPLPDGVYMLLVGTEYNSKLIIRH